MADNVRDHLLEVLRTSEYSDFTLTCQGHEFKLHKAVVCPQSSMIKTALQGPFIEGKTNTIAADNFELSTIKSLVKYLYEGFYGPEEDEEEDEGENDTEDQRETEEWSERDTSRGIPADMGPTIARLCRHVTINAAADYYQITHLCDYSENKLREDLKRHFKEHTLLPVIQFALKESPDKNLHCMLAEMAAELLANNAFNNELCQMKLPREFRDLIFEQCGRLVAHNDAVVKKWKSQIEKHGNACEGCPYGWNRGLSGLVIYKDSRGYYMKCRDCHLMKGGYYVAV